MSRLLPILVLVLLAAACGDTVGNPGVAAAVGDVEIPVSLVEARFAEVAGSPGYDELLSQGGPVEAERLVTGGVLGQLIQLELLEQALRERDLDLPTDAEVQAELDAIVEEQFGGMEAFETQILEPRGLSLESALEQVRLGVLVQRLQDDVVADVEVTEEEVREIYDTQLGVLNVSHILVDTEEAARDVLERLEDGEDFAAVAAEVSTDPGSAAQGGVLGPLQPGAYVPEFEEAAVALEPGTFSEPVETQFGFHIITTQAPPPFEDVRDEAEQLAREQLAQRLVEDAMSELLFSADVVVNPRFGRWDGIQRQVVFEDPLGALQPVDGQAPEDAGVGVQADGTPMPPPPDAGGQ